ncbi:MAG: hypothetical protein IJR58_04860 [Lachnospiraceae bacterium]|nr:hypothetical protein [Lachnospiraceae bacterium]
MYVIGVDLGTQSMKGLLVDPNGKIVGEAHYEYDPIYPNPGWAEEKVADWKAALKSVIAQLLEETYVKPEEIGTIGFDTINDSIVVADKDGEALMNSIIWLDRRAEAETRAMGEKIDENKLFSLTGLNLDSSHSAPKILWVRNNRPDVYEKAKYFYSVDSYMVHWLTGEVVVDYSVASSALVYNVAEKKFDEELCRLFDIDPGVMGALGAAEDVVGTIRPEIAAELGLAPGTKVIRGAGDEHTACLGCGLVKPGMVADITGTAEPVCAVAGKPVFDTIGHLVETHAHADQRWWLVENPGFVSGGSTRWFRDTIFRFDSYDYMNVASQKSPIGSNGVLFLPCMSGAMTPTWNGNARGTFTGLSLSHTMNDISRSVFEGIAFGLRDNIDRFEEIGIDVNSVYIVGGGTKSPLWCQMKADLLGKPMDCSANAEGAAIGTAMLAAVAEGTFADLDEAAAVMAQLGAHYEPNPANKAAYDEAYGRYQECYKAMEPFFNKCYQE